MVKLYKTKDLENLKLKERKYRYNLIIESIVVMALLVLFTSMMDYYFYSLIKISNIILTTFYVFSLFFIVDNYIITIRKKFKLYKKYTTLVPSCIVGEILNIEDEITNNGILYNLIEIKINDYENKKVYCEVERNSFNKRDKYKFELIDNVIVAYGDNHE